MPFSDFSAFSAFCVFSVFSVSNVFVKKKELKTALITSFILLLLDLVFLVLNIVYGNLWLGNRGKSRDSKSAGGGGGYAVSTTMIGKKKIGFKWFKKAKIMLKPISF